MEKAFFLIFQVCILSFNDPVLNFREEMLTFNRS